MSFHRRAGTTHEARALADGYRLIAGVDEVGRGCLAGPVVSAAVILPVWVFDTPFTLATVRDSKIVPEIERDALREEIAAMAMSIGIGSSSNDEIDRIGIANATRRAMMRAILSLSVTPDIVLIDFVHLPDLSIEQRNIVDGDALSLSIAAASIVAKTARDSEMRSVHALYPHYGFNRNKGYGTAGHLEALRKNGPCPLHRQSFAPLRQGILLGRPSTHNSA